MSTEVTPGEIQVIKWGEKILIPVIGTLAAVAIAGLFQMHNAVAQLETKMEIDDQREVVDQQAAKTTREDINEMKLQLNEVETHYGHLVEDVDKLEKRSQQILNILTGNGHNHTEG